MKMESIIKRAIATEQRKYLLMGVLGVTLIVSASFALSIGLTPSNEKNTIGFYQTLEVGDVLEFNTTQLILNRTDRAVMNQSISIYEITIDQKLPRSASLDTFDMSEYISMEIDGVEANEGWVQNQWIFYIAPDYITDEDGVTTKVAQDEWHLFVHDELAEADTMEFAKIHEDDGDRANEVFYDVNATMVWEDGTTTSEMTFEGTVDVRRGYTLDFTKTMEWSTHIEIHSVEFLSHMTS